MNDGSSPFSSRILCAVTSANIIVRCHAVHYLAASFDGVLSHGKTWVRSCEAF